ncbi:GRAM domain-containing protein 1B-like isoform X3 [Phthorimaea operculella]|nr:GRAM domain-containing protein 1B-like isoform X3 [Phthorimaea operculella]
MGHQEHSWFGEEFGFGSDDEGYSRDTSLPALPPLDAASEVRWATRCGEELGFGSDDEGYSRDTSLPALPPLDAASELDLVDSSMEAVSGAETRDDRSTRGSRSRDRDSSPPLVTNGDTGFAGGGAEGDGEGDTLPTDMSDTSDSDDKDKHTDEKCTSEHGGKLLMRGQFPFNIDQLFTMIFTNSKFNLELLAARGTTDYVQAPWQVAGGQKCRQVSYVLGLTSGPIGPKEVHVTETQVMNKCSKPGHLYSIDASSENTGIPYADYFTVECHYCLSRISEHMTDFSLIGYVKYKKSMWPMVKAFLEKNTMSGLEEYGRLMEARLIAEAQGQVPAARKSRRQRRSNVSSSEVPPITAKVPPAAILAPRASLPRARPVAAATNNWLVGSLVILLALNALLYWRLYHPPHGHDLQSRLREMGTGDMADWSALLDTHTNKQRGQLLAWREALDNTVAHLRQTEQALRKLLETIEPSLAKADETNSQHEQTNTHTGKDATDKPPDQTPKQPVKGEL